MNNFLNGYAGHLSSRENKNDVESDTPSFRSHLTGLRPVTQPTTDLHNLVAHLHQLIGTKVDRHRPALGIPVVGGLCIEVVGELFRRNVGDEGLNK